MPGSAGHFSTGLTDASINQLLKNFLKKKHNFWLFSFDVPTIFGSFSFDVKFSGYPRLSTDSSKSK